MMLDLVKWLRNEATLYGASSVGKDLRDKLNMWANELETTNSPLPYEAVRALLPGVKSDVIAVIADGVRETKAWQHTAMAIPNRGARHDDSRQTENRGRR